MSNILYSPKIEGTTPSFYGNQIKIFFEHSKVVAQSDYDSYVLQIKDPLANDAVIIQSQLAKSDQEKGQLVFDVDTARLFAGQYYKLNLAYKSDGTIGYYSDMSVTKYMGPLAPLVTLTLNQNFTAGLQYIPPEADKNEKLFSVRFRLYLKGELTNILLEETEDIILNYSKIELPANGSCTTTYDFAPYFSFSTEFTDFSETELHDLGTMYGLLRYDDILDEYGNATGNRVINYHKTFQALNEAGYFSPRDEYVVEADVKTINGFTQTYTHTERYQYLTGEDFIFDITQNKDESLVSIRLFADDAQITNINNTDIFNNFWLVKRNHYQNTYSPIAKSNEDESFTDFIERISSSGEIIDFNLEQGNVYSYYLIYYKSDRYYLAHSIEIYIDFEDIFLCDSTHILKLRFNPKVTGYKTTIQQSKMDTLGGQYPMFFKNGSLGYKEFSISALVSYLQDPELYFVYGLTDPKYNQLKYHLFTGYLNANINPTMLEEAMAIRIRNELLQLGTNMTVNLAQQQSFLPGTGLNKQNVYVERQFKQAVLDWLNNGEFKLFKSATEGNYIIRILNVTTAPEDKLNRMLWTFTLQVVEAMEYNDNNIKSLNMQYYHGNNTQLRGGAINAV